MKRPPIVSLLAHPSSYVTPRELAAYLPCDPRTILRIIAAGSLRAYRVGRNYRIPIDEARRAFPVGSE